MPAESVDDVLRDFMAFLNDALAAHAFATMGLRRIPQYLLRVPPTPENPDPEIGIGIGDPNTTETRTYAAWPLSKALEQVAKDGPVETRLAQQWIVYVFTAWEHDFRPRLAAAHGCAPGDIVCPLFGDFRILRHDVVHEHGIATLGNAGRCEVIRHWFTIGAPITLLPEHFEELRRLVPWDALRAAPRT